MQLQLLAGAISREEKLWFAARVRECHVFNDHGVYTEIVDGKTYCSNCETRV